MSDFLIKLPVVFGPVVKCDWSTFSCFLPFDTLEVCYLVSFKHMTENKAIWAQEWTALIPRENIPLEWVESGTRGQWLCTECVFNFVRDVMCVYQREDMVESLQHNRVPQCGWPHPFLLAPLNRLFSGPQKTALTRFLKKEKKSTEVGKEGRGWNKIPDFFFFKHNKSKRKPWERRRENKILI